MFHTKTLSAACGLSFLYGFTGMPACAQAAPVGAVQAGPGVLQVRGGLPNTFAKLKSGQPVTVVYLGGSITAGAGASKPAATSYRALVGQWLTTNYPGAAVTNVNAGYGGTGSDFGAFRLEHDVLTKKPDLVFVEFAVNDGLNVLADRGMEGIVRHVRRASPNTDVCFLYVFNRSQLAAYQSGGVPGAVGREEAVASYYNVPSVNVGLAGAQKIMRGDVTPALFFHDGTHPADAGHQAYADAIIALLQDQARSATAAKRYTLPAPLRADSMENARMIAPEEVQPLAPGWSIVDKRLPSQFQSVLTADTPGAQQSIPFSGPTLALYLSLGTDAGSFDYKVDAGEWKTVDPFDFKRYGHSSYRLLEDGLAPADHVLTVRINPNHNPASLGTVTRIGFVCVSPVR